MIGQSVQEMVTGTGLPCVHLAWREGCAPALPWCTYFLDENPNFASDNSVHANINHWCVEHYYKTFDQTKTEALEEAIASEFGYFTIGSESWIDDEQVFMTAYYFTEIGE